MCHLSDCPVLLVYDALKARTLDRRFVNIFARPVADDGELRNALIAVYPTSFERARMAPRCGIYRGQGKTLSALTGHVFTFACFRHLLALSA